ncbi:glycosyltransferase [Candidatus Uhrbacteria bacterium]|nr:glycosyltransferase [Candidatus Uhrbacteria bacterium]
MQVALVHDHLNQIGGAERVLKSMLEIYPDSPVFTLLHDEKRTGSWFEGTEVIPSFIQRLPASQRLFKWYLPIMPTAIEELPVGGFDCIISSSSALVKGILPPPQTLHVCYCHTPTRYLWSNTRQYLEELPQRRMVKLILPFLLQRLRLWDWQAAQRVDRFIANSRFVASRIRTYYQRASTVIYPPVDVDRYVPTNDPIEPFYLLISRLRPYKRVDVAITAFNKMNIPLVVIGSGEEAARLRRLAGSKIRFLGSVDDTTKAWYLSHCRALIFPQEEDFGITAVEAMAAGRPVVAYRAGGAPESVIEGLSGTLFEHQRWESLADAVIHFDPTQFDPARIREHAQQFSRDRFQRELSQFVDQSWKEFQEGKGRV